MASNPATSLSPDASADPPPDPGRDGRDVPDPRSADPATQRATERRVASHVRGLLADRRFVVPTTFGPRPVMSLQQTARVWDQSSGVKKRMVELGVPDFDLQERLPTGEGFDVRLTRQVLLAFNQTLGHVRFASLPPTDALIRGQSPRPLTATQVRDSVLALPPPTDKNGETPDGPMTLILFSGAGFTDDARRVAETFVDGPPTLLIEPDGVGGFLVSGPPGSEALRELLDPEDEAEQAGRARAAIEARRVDLLTGGVALDRVAASTRLPLRLVEAEARRMAKEAASRGDGLRVKLVAGAPMLYRDGSLSQPLSAGGSRGSIPTTSGGSMALMDRLKRLIGLGDDRDRKISLMAERRAALARQRDAAHDELSALEEREQQLRDEFKAASNLTTRRRLTSQILQLQKDVERRRQAVQVVNQQINVVSTHLHNLEIARQSGGALPRSEEIAEDAAKAEEVLADLQASSELADDLVGHMSTGGMTDEEQALFESLSAEAGRQPTPAADEPLPDPIPLPGPGVKHRPATAAPPGAQPAPPVRQTSPTSPAVKQPSAAEPEPG